MSTTREALAALSAEIVKSMRAEREARDKEMETLKDRIDALEHIVSVMVNADDDTEDAPS